MVGWNRRRALQSLDVGSNAIPRAGFRSEAGTLVILVAALVALAEMVIFPLLKIALAGFVCVWVLRRLLQTQPGRRVLGKALSFAVRSRHIWLSRVSLISAISIALITLVWPYVAGGIEVGGLAASGVAEVMNNIYSVSHLTALHYLTIGLISLALIVATYWLGRTVILSRLASRQRGVVTIEAEPLDPECDEIEPRSTVIEPVMDVNRVAISRRSSGVSQSEDAMALWIRLAAPEDARLAEDAAREAFDSLFRRSQKSRMVVDRWTNANGVTLRISVQGAVDMRGEIHVLEDVRRLIWDNLHRCSVCSSMALK